MVCKLVTLFVLSSVAVASVSALCVIPGCPTPLERAALTCFKVSPYRRPVMDCMAKYTAGSPQRRYCMNTAGVPHLNFCGDPNEKKLNIVQCVRKFPRHSPSQEWEDCVIEQFVGPEIRAKASALERYVMECRQIKANSAFADCILGYAGHHRRGCLNRIGTPQLDVCQWQGMNIHSNINDVNKAIKCFRDAASEHWFEDCVAGKVAAAYRPPDASYCC